MEGVMNAIIDKLRDAGKEPATNPKSAFSGKKPRLTLVPLTAQLKQIEAQLDGALKYGEVNWREVEIQYKTYADAALRHLQLAINGEDTARDTTVDNLGAVMACCAILIDSKAHGTLVDNRDHSPAACDAIVEAEKMVAHLKKMQEERDRQAKNATVELDWRRYDGGRPNLYGHRAIEVKSHGNPEVRRYVLGPHPEAFDWYGVEKWRPYRG
jgi:hypothetical protein